MLRTVTITAFLAVVVQSITCVEVLADLKLPLEGGKSYQVTVGYNGVSIFLNSDGSPFIDKYHQGNNYFALDFDNPPGDEDITICAVDSGMVELVYDDPTTGLGFGVRIRHANNNRTIYGHFKNMPLVKVNDNVSQGQPLGKMGQTGFSKGTHLHFVLKDENGISLKPEPMSGYTDFTPGRIYYSDNYNCTKKPNPPFINGLVPGY